MSSSRSATRRGLLLVISSPSGAGKTSLSRRLIGDQPDLSLSISATTRGPRPGEQDGKEYWFMDAARFQAMVSDGAFLEWAEVHEHCYGSLKRPVFDHLSTGRDVLFDIDWQGAQAIAMAAPADTVRVFILPPSMADLAKRLHTRAQDSQAVIERRLGRARGEISHWGEYDYVIVNDDIDQAYAELTAIYRTERLRQSRNLWIEPMVNALLAEI